MSSRTCQHLFEFSHPHPKDHDPIDPVTAYFSCLCGALCVSNDEPIICDIEDCTDLAIKPYPFRCEIHKQV